MDPSKLLPGFAFISGPQKAAAIYRNLRTNLDEHLNLVSFSVQDMITNFVCSLRLPVHVGSLLRHAESLIPTFLNEDDLQLLR